MPDPVNKKRQRYYTLLYKFTSFQVIATFKISFESILHKNIKRSSKTWFNIHCEFAAEL